MVEVRAVGFVDDEPATGKTNQSLAAYQSLLSVFDALGHNERLQLIDLAAAFKELDAKGRAQLLEYAAFVRGR